MGVMSGLDALPKPPTSKAAHRRALRATNPFKTLRLADFSSQARKNRNAALKGLVAPNRCYSPLGREISPGCDGVRGKPPTKSGTWACLFARWGGKIFAAPPGLLNSLWANVRRWARMLKISNFSEIEFSFRAPLPYFTS